MEIIKKIFAMAIIFLTSCMAFPKMFIEVFMKNGSASPGGSLQEIITNLLTLSFILLILNSALRSLDKSEPKPAFWEFKLPTQTIQQTPLAVGCILGVLTTVKYYS